MNVLAFQPSGQRRDFSATTATGPQAIDGSGVMEPLTVRICNGSLTDSALFAAGGATVDATTDIRAVEVLPGSERVFQWPSGARFADVVMRAGVATVSVQVGSGV